jgi:general secretion pathway protein H
LLLNLASPSGRCAVVRPQLGMTLIEIMIVISLMGLLLGTVVFGSGMFGGANRRAAATLMVVAVNKGLSHANTIGKPVRLALNLTSGQVTLEQAGSKLALVGASAEEEEPPDAAALLLAEAEAAADQVLSGGAKHDPGFSPVDLLGQDGEAAGRTVGSGVKLLKVQTEHDEEPITDGIAYIYFWPGGLTERAIIQIAKVGDDDGLTVEISPLTGRAQIQRGLLDLPEGVFSPDEEFSEREEL